MRCRFEEKSVRPKKEAGEPKEKREEIEAETCFDVNVHFATLSRDADSKRSRSDQRKKQANPKRSERKSKQRQVLMRMFILRHCRECRFEEESVRPKKEAGKPKEKREEIEAETGFDVNVHFATLS